MTTGAWLVSAAVAANLAAQNRVNSVATFVAVAIVAGLVVTGRPTRRLADIAPAGIAVSAAALSVFRASPWIVGPAAAVAMTGLVAAAHGVLATDRRLARTALDAIDDLVDTPAWLARPIRATATSTTNRGIARGVVLASLAVLPLTLLLAAADAAFGQLLVGLVQQGFLVHLAISAVLLVPVGGVVLGSRRADRTERSVNPVERSPWFPTMTEGTIVLTAVVVLFGIWGATQVVVALGGAERLLAAANLSAAENARQGFFPLVAVTAIVAGLLVAVDRMTTRATAADRRRFRLLTTIIGVETVGLVVAAFSRLALYIDGFGHTMLRLSVAWFLAFLAVAVIALVVGMNRRSVGVRRSLDSLALLAGVWVLAFGLFGPEAFIANRNIDRSITVSSEAADPPSATGESENRQPQLDATYLASDLGADAVPTVVSRLGELDADSMVAIRDALCLGHDSGSVGIAGWNRAEQRAADAIATLNCR